MPTTLPKVPAGRQGQLILGCDPGAHMGFALTRTNPELVDFCVRRSEVLALATQLDVAGGWVKELKEEVIILIEDQYAGVAGVASRTTLSQRAGAIAGFFMGRGVPEVNLIFVAPNAWYKGVGMSHGMTKAVCLNRIEHALLPSTRQDLELICGVDGAYPKHRLDVLAAVGIAWSFPFLPPTALSKGQKMRALKTRKPCAKKKVGRRAKAVARGQRRG